MPYIPPLRRFSQLNNKLNEFSGVNVISANGGCAIQFPNGIQICTKSADVNVGNMYAWGNGYSSATNLRLGDYAAPFTEVYASTIYGQNTALWTTVNGSGSTTSFPSFFAITIGSGYSNTTQKFSGIAIGRWK